MREPVRPKNPVEALHGRPWTHQVLGLTRRPPGSRPQGTRGTPEKSSGGIFFRATLVFRAQLLLLRSKFDDEFEFRVSSVVPGRSIDLAERVGLTGIVPNSYFWINMYVCEI